MPGEIKPPPALTEGWVCVGRLGRPLGLKGWSRFTQICEEVNLLKQPLQMLLPGSAPKLQPLSPAPLWNASNTQVKLACVHEREGAMRHTHATLWVSRACLPTLENTQNFYWFELQGFQVFTSTAQGHQRLGEVEGLTEGPGYDYLILTPDSPCPSLWIPFLWETFILHVDRARREIQVDGERLEL